jgi:hypothetical protein
VSELLIFTGAFRAVATGTAGQAAAAGVAITVLALVGGLAAACFTKAFGISFLGEPRSPEASAAVEVQISMTAPLIALAVGCAAIGLFGSVAVAALAPLAASTAGLPPIDGAAALASLGAGLWRVSATAAALAGIVAALTLIRARLHSRRAKSQVGTWDCGYLKPDARMQYTSSSFAQPLIAMFRGLLGTRRRWTAILAPFPGEASFSTKTPDVFAQRVFRPAFNRIGSLFSRLRWLQHGRLQLYVLYIAAALLALLVWRLT